MGAERRRTRPWSPQLTPYFMPPLSNTKASYSKPSKTSECHHGDNRDSVRGPRFWRLLGCAEDILPQHTEALEGCQEEANRGYTPRETFCAREF